MSKSPENPEVIDVLNDVLTAELTAINQYFLHSELCHHWGYGKLHKVVRAHSIGEMKHADAIIERVLLLDGLPNLQDLGKLQIGEDVPEILRADLSVETKNRGDVQDAIVVCETNRDFVSRDILTGILDDTEEHIDWLETQLGLIEQVGIENCIAEAMHVEE